MVLSAVLFSFMGPLVRFLPGIPALEVLVVRAVIALLICVPWLKWQKKPILGRDHKWLVGRGLLGFAGLTIYVYSMQKMPLAEAVVIQYTNPIFTALFAPFVLKEAWRGGEWLATILAFAGVVLIAGAGAGGHAGIAMLGLGGAVCVGLAYNIVRKLGLGGEDPLTIVIYLPLACLFLGIPLAAPSWKTPSGRELVLLIALGISTSLGQIELTKGLRLERAARATVVNYSIILLSTIYGLGFGEIPTLRSILGMALVVCSLLLVSRRQVAVAE